jgi:hypothetical protein
MCRFLFAMLVSVLPGLVMAQSYVATSFLYNKLSIGCATANTCESKKGGFQLSGGAKLPSELTFDLGGLMLDTVEVGFSKYGREDARGVVRKKIFTGGPSSPLQNLPTYNSISANAIYSALVAHFNVDSDLSLNGKLGVAYVSATSEYTEGGVSMKAVTENHLEPVIGAGAEYVIFSGMKLIGGLEVTRFKTNSQSGSVRSLVLGAQFSY